MYAIIMKNKSQSQWSIDISGVAQDSMVIQY